MPNYETFNAPDDRDFDFAELHQEDRDEPELVDCQGCGASTLEESLTWIGNGWNFRGCPTCVAACERVEAEEAEPACSCTQTDVDLFDARGCELHDDRSDWNVARRAVTATQRYYQEVA